MLLSDKQQIVKATNSKFMKNEENDSNSCKSGKNMQLERVLKSEHVDFKDFDNKNSSSDDESDDHEIVSENAGENKIFTLSSNPLNSPTANLDSMNFNKTIKTDKIINI